MTSPELLVMIGVVTTSIVTIISALGQFWGKNSSASMSKKLDAAETDRAETRKTIEDTKNKVETVHENTNGKLSAATARISELEAINRLLIERMVITSTSNPPNPNK